MRCGSASRPTAGPPVGGGTQSVVTNLHLGPLRSGHVRARRGRSDWTPPPPSPAGRRRLPAPRGPRRTPASTRGRRSSRATYSSTNACPCSLPSAWRSSPVGMPSMTGTSPSLPCSAPWSREVAGISSPHSSSSSKPVAIRSLASRRCCSPVAARRRVEVATQAHVEQVEQGGVAVQQLGRELGVGRAVVGAAGSPPSSPHDVRKRPRSRARRSRLIAAAAPRSPAGAPRSRPGPRRSGARGCRPRGWPRGPRRPTTWWRRARWRGSRT